MFSNEHFWISKWIYARVWCASVSRGRRPFCFWLNKKIFLATMRSISVRHVSGSESVLHPATPVHGESYSYQMTTQKKEPMNGVKGK